MDIFDFAKGIEGRKDFEEFLARLERYHYEQGEEWENNDLGSFISAMSRFAGDIDGYYRNQGMDVDSEQPSWRVFADILLAATVYE